MQRSRQHVVRGAVVTALPALLAALLLVLSGSAYGASAAAPSGHRTSTTRSAATDSVPAVVPPLHRTASHQRLDGAGPALLPDRAESPRPTYTSGRVGAAHDRPLSRSHGAARGRAPPA